MNILNTIKSSFQNHIPVPVINEITDYIIDRMYELQGSSSVDAGDFMEFIEKEVERNEVTESQIYFDVHYN